MRKSTVKPLISFGVRVTPDLYRQIKELANQYDCSVNSLIQEILEQTMKLRAKINQESNGDQGTKIG